ncbi:hypothetical protein EYF80_007669 [Liparis tanakae]|uniref:Uncharacterized protein n=1 Tax=Liparis tanakae TaxID=230148 RepID=A0A4Z2IXN7_9TELE|nr:hypothetical protein EYF80_007669 [Liparis tanakae]
MLGRADGRPAAPLSTHSPPPCSTEHPFVAHPYLSLVSTVAPLPFSYTLTHDLQKVDTASARWRGDPDKAEAGGGLVADMGSNHAANKLGSTKLALWHHT